MRRLVTISILVLAGAALAAAPALAKQLGANLDPPAPVGVEPGEPWAPSVFIVTEEHGLQTAGGPPTLTVRDASGATTEFVAAAGQEPGFYNLRVVFPEAGTYRYWVTDPVTGRRYDFPAVTIGEPVAAAPVARPDDPVPVAVDEGSFPLVPVAAGAAAGLVLLVLTLLYVRRGPRSAARAAQ
jgi:hypothetical protein